jgi:hypothetical protein
MYFSNFGRLYFSIMRFKYEGMLKVNLLVSMELMAGSIICCTSGQSILSQNIQAWRGVSKVPEVTPPLGRHHK